MDMGPYLSSLHQALTAVTRSFAPEVQQAADHVAESLEPGLRLTLMQMASDIAAEVTVQLEGDLVEVRLRGGAPEIVVERAPQEAEPPSPPPAPAPPTPEDDGGTARISLRLPDALKSQVDQAAASEAVSVNTWLVRAVQRALTTPGAPSSAEPTTSARRLDGWAR